MSTVRHSDRTVKATKPLRLVKRYFGEGLEDPAEPTWAPAVRVLLSGLNYTPSAVSAAIESIATHGHAGDCPDVEPADAELVNRIIGKGVQASLEAEADFQADGDAGGHPDAWLALTDAFRPVPSIEDRSWFAEMIENDVKAEASPRLERRALESRSLDNLSRGLIAPDFAERIAASRTGFHHA
jgi:hypothetical protein